MENETVKEKIKKPYIKKLYKDYTDEEKARHKASQARYYARKCGKDVPKIKLQPTAKQLANLIPAGKEEKHFLWKGDQAKKNSGHKRAHRKFDLTNAVCRIGVGCSKRLERHHIDGNPLNNEPENIDILCTRHHQEIDGRRAKLIEQVKHFKDAGLITGRPKKIME